MDFFTRQDASRRATRLLVVLFGLAFLAVALATAVAVAIGIGLFQANSSTLSTTIEPGWSIDPNIQTVAGITLLTMALMVLASLVRTATLSRGGGQVARMLGGTRIFGDATDPLHRRLVNVIEEMAIASGLPVPEIYVLEQEAGINAFAAGATHSDAAVAVTRGCLEQLSRAELSGVIAHEFSHILNGDMRLNLRLMGFGFGILVLSLVGRWLLRGSLYHGRSRNRGNGGIVALGFALTVIGGIGVLLSRLIKAAVSRQREVLADASAVQFTREPMALAGALKKIGGLTTHLTATDAEEVSHMLFGRASGSFRGWFATHPPLAERIRALDPSFSAERYERLKMFPDAESRPGETAQLAAGLAGSSSVEATSADSIGTMVSRDTAAALHGAIPEGLNHAAHSNDLSLILILAMAVASDAQTREQQAALLEAQIGARRTSLCLRFRRDLDSLDRRLWLPLVEIAVPSLKQRPNAQIEFLFDLLAKLARLNLGKPLLDYAIVRLLSAYFVTAGIAVSELPKDSGFSSNDALFVLLATVAAFGHEDERAARAAFNAGVPDLSAQKRASAESVFERCLAERKLEHLDLSLDALRKLSLPARRHALRALEIIIKHDGHIGVAEAELFRVIGASLGCPIPPASALR
jgi:Zn-dependent protease with chaperone function